MLAFDPSMPHTEFVRQTPHTKEAIMTTSVKSDMGCINCGFTTSDSDEFKFHPCHQAASRNDFAVYRAQVKEAKAEAKRDEIEIQILYIIGETVEESLISPRFNRLRSLFAEWESADSELGEATEKVIRLSND
jgi:hypothetical protein